MNLRQHANEEFAALCRRVKVMEESLVKICFFFDDDVLQTVVAIVRAPRVSFYPDLTNTLLVGNLYPSATTSIRRVYG